jgi:ubiquinone/menaquinone biosynthesis C-methylase UbiE
MSRRQSKSPSQYVEFWNTILASKFNTWRHVLAGGLGQHNAKVFPALQLRSGDRVLDAGCGWGDTAIEIAGRVGPTGSVTGVDCCGAFLEIARADAKAEGLANACLRYEMSPTSRAAHDPATKKTSKIRVSPAGISNAKVPAPANVRTQPFLRAGR